MSLSLPQLSVYNEEKESFKQEKVNLHSLGDICLLGRILGCVVSLTQLIFNGDFNARQANDCCETYP